jgi:hypothetical protein
MGAFLTNPWTLAAAGAIITGVMLWRHFRNGTEKRLANAIQAEYGIDVKEMSVLKQVKELGEQAFGKGNASKHLQETVRLEPVKELLAQYAESTGQSSSRLVTNAQFADSNFSANRFIRRIAGGLIPGANRGFDHVPVLSDGGEYMLRAGAVARVGVQALDELNQGRAEVSPVGRGRSRGESESGGGNQSFVTAALVGALERSNQVIESLEKKLRTMRPGEVLSAAIDEDPYAIGLGLERAIDMGSGHVQRALKKTGMR